MFVESGARDNAAESTHLLRLYLLLWLISFHQYPGLTSSKQAGFRLNYSLLLSLKAAAMLRALCI